MFTHKSLPGRGLKIFAIVTIMVTIYLVIYSFLKPESKINHLCHHITIDCDFPELKDDQIAVSKTVFFIETSCRGGINARQACCIESFAKMNPKWQVNVLFAGPVTNEERNKSPLKHLLQMPQLHFYRIYKLKYSKGTPVEKLFERKVINLSPYFVEHSSDVLRFLTLYKYGGIYMDTDFVTVKSFDSLPPTWITREFKTCLAAGALALAKDGVGKMISNATLHYLSKEYDPNSWSQNSAGVLGKAVAKHCGGNNITLWSNLTCKGVRYMSEEHFFHFHYSQANDYFSGSGTLQVTEQEYAFHMWNAITRNYVIQNGSWYAQLAHKYCPNTYQNMKSHFGGK